MKQEIISSLAIGMLVVVAAQVIISWRTGNWAFTSSSQKTAQRLFTAWTLLVPFFACASLFRWIDSFWFILFAVGGQIVWQLWLAGSKLLENGKTEQSAPPLPRAPKAGHSEGAR
jgi:hypothetical protein